MRNGAPEIEQWSERVSMSETIHVSRGQGSISRNEVQLCDFLTLIPLCHGPVLADVDIHDAFWLLKLSRTLPEFLYYTTLSLVFH